MPEYTFTAIDQEGKKTTGRIGAYSQADAERYLSVRGLWPISIRMEQAPNPLFGGIGVRDLIFLSSRMGYMLAAGIPLSQTLDDLEVMAASPRLKFVLQDINRRLREGSRLSEAMEAYPEIFDILYRNVIRAGEEGGDLPRAFQSMAQHIEERHRFRREVRQALTYPVFAGTIITGVFLFYLFYVLPNLLPLIKDLTGEAEPPLPTRILLFIGENALLIGGGILFGVIAAIATIIVSHVYQPFRLIVHRLLLRIPRIGWILACAVYGRVCRTLGTLFNAGLPILEILELTAPVAGNLHIEGQIKSLLTYIQQGTSFHEASKQSGFPYLFTSMIKTGEVAGKLVQVFEEMTKFFEDEMRYQTRAMIALIEPALIIMLALPVFMILVGVLFPLYSAISRLGH